MGLFLIQKNNTDLTLMSSVSRDINFTLDLTLASQF